MVKRSKKVLHRFLLKVLKVVAKCCLDWIELHYDLYCCLKCSNIEYIVDVLYNLSLKAMLKGVWLNLVFLCYDIINCLAL